MNNCVYKKFNVKPVINASGKMTILGGSRVSEQVSGACREGAANFFEVADLLDKTGAYIADLLDVEASYIVSSASSGIAQCVGASIVGNDYGKLLHIYDSANEHREIVMPKGHNVDYGTPIEVTIALGGGKLVEAGYANACKVEHVENCITKQTVALLYVKSHHCVQKGILSIEDMASLAKKYELPLIIDAAAEADLTKYYHLGGDAVIYSGTKALEGPTSGIIVGREAFINKVKRQSKGIGRVMKVGKENILGLVEAIESFVSKPALSLEEQRDRFTLFHEQMQRLQGVSCACVQDEAGRAIIRSELHFDDTCKYDAHTIAKKLKEGDIHIYTRDYRTNTGYIEIDVRDVSDEELQQLYEKIKYMLEGENE